MRPGCGPNTEPSPGHLFHTLLVIVLAVRVGCKDTRVGRVHSSS